MLPPRVGHQQVDRAFGQEELVGGKVDLLATKVPDVGGVLAGLRGYRTSGDGTNESLNPYKTLLANSAGGG